MFFEKFIRINIVLEKLNFNFSDDRIVLPTFFVKHYLRGGKFLKNVILSEKYNGPLNEPKKNLSYYFDLLISKIKLYKLLIFTKSS